MKILKAKKNCYVSLRIYPREIYFFQILGQRAKNEKEMRAARVSKRVLGGMS